MCASFRRRTAFADREGTRAKALGISEREVTHALTFWRGAGAISSGRKNSADKAESESSGGEKAAAVPKRHAVSLVRRSAALFLR